MKNSRIFIALLIAAMASAACSNSKNDASSSDSSTMGAAARDTVTQDTSAVKHADSTHSYRNDRGTDSVSAGKSIPSKP